MHASSSPRKPRWLMLGLAGLLILPLAGLQLAWAQATAPRIVKTAMATVTETPAKLASVFTVMPTTGNLSSGYGRRLNPITHKRSLHDGVDISAPIGTPVYAPASGRVTRADLAEPGYGKVMIIDHGNGYTTRYMHLGEFEVRAGDTVQAGQLIAKSGNTGRSTGPHTHIGVFKDGKPIDPATVMQLPAAS
jgi:murein DD-endopeptidase MepM/ murein hydrolase activator NlpD